MGYSIKNVVMLVLSLVMIGILLPIGLAYIGGMENSAVYINGTLYDVVDVVDPTVITLVTIILPIVAVIGIILAFTKFGNND